MTTPQSATAPQQTPQQGRPSEVTTMAALLDDLKAMEADALNELDNARAAESDATAELEDAQADASRAGEDSTRVELMVASARVVSLDADTSGALAALQDTNGSRVQLAATRATLAEQAQGLAASRAVAAENRASAAVTAHRGIEARHQAVREAVQEANANGGAAERIFHVPA